MGQTINDGRLLWLDWMKVWATLAVIWGHFFAKGDVYVFVFNLQVFCVISGFLYKKSSNWKVCIQKCFWQLLVPTIIMSTMMHMDACLRCKALGLTYDISWSWFFEWLLLGHRWCMGPCWYFYSLIVMRLIMQALPEKKWVYFLLFIALSAGAICLHLTGNEISNANTNVLVCMPFFIIGIFLKPLREVASRLHNFAIEIVFFALAVIGIILCGNYNGYVWMYLGEYGNNFALYIAGGLAGSLLLYTISLWLSRLPYRNMVILLSKGSILIIGFHIIIVRRLTELPERLWFEDVMLSVMILLFFVPVVQLAERFFPVLIGQYQR